MPRGQRGEFFAALTEERIGSDNDPAEAYPGDLQPPPRLVVRTNGARGGTYAIAGGSPQQFVAVPATVTGDTYGAGDTFAAAIAFGLGEGQKPADAIVFAAARAAEVLAFDGPYGG